MDSAALFHILASNEVEFDCAFVNYQTREQSLIEEENARALCSLFGKEIYVKKASLNLLSSSNFEKEARDIRHKFFDEICLKFGYDTQIFAHQLNDSLEWLFMQLSKGSGASLLVGMDHLSYKTASFGSEHKEILISRPLLDISKKELLDYLQTRNLRYFVDDSNFNTKFKRNFIRENFSDKFIDEFKQGVIKSLNFLREDKKSLIGEFAYENLGLFLVEKSPNSIHLIDKACKKLGVLMSQKTRLECLKGDCVVSHKVAITSNSKYYFITPYILTKLSKDFKERCRTFKIPALNRGFFSLDQKHLDLYLNYIFSN